MTCVGCGKADSRAAGQDKAVWGAGGGQSYGSLGEPSSRQSCGRKVPTKEMVFATNGFLQENVGFVGGVSSLLQGPSSASVSCYTAPLT